MSSIARSLTEKEMEMLTDILMQESTLSPEILELCKDKLRRDLFSHVMDLNHRWCYLDLPEITDSHPDVTEEDYREWLRSVLYEGDISIADRIHNVLTGGSLITLNNEGVEELRGYPTRRGRNHTLKGYYDDYYEDVICDHFMEALARAGAGSD